jgi:hypothetical protein
LGIDFPGVTRDNTVSRTATATPPADWIDPVTGALNVPGYGMIPPLTHHRTETGCSCTVADPPVREARPVG